MHERAAVGAARRVGVIAVVGVADAPLGLIARHHRVVELAVAVAVVVPVPGEIAVVVPGVAVVVVALVDLTVAVVVDTVTDVETQGIHLGIAIIAVLVVVDR